jgi:membrane protein required for colicin V production
MSTTINILDLVFITFTIIFVVTAFFRGFVKEVFALFSWILALTLSYLLAPYAADLLGKFYNNKLAIDISARSIIFVIVFFVTATSTSGLCKSLKDKVPLVFDRSLGVLFGLIKTLLIFGFVYALALNLFGFLLGKASATATDKMPIWLKEAKCYSILRFSGEILDPLVKKFFDAATENFDQVIPKPKNLDEKIDEVVDEKNKATENLDASSDDLQKALKDSGYNKKDIEKMNRLIEIIDK